MVSYPADETSVWGRGSPWHKLIRVHRPQWHRLAAAEIQPVGLEPIFVRGDSRDECPATRDCPAPPPPAIVWVDPCPDHLTCALPDITLDGNVDVRDFLKILFLWGVPCQPQPYGDIDWDGWVGVTDMFIVLDAWVEGYDPSTWDRCDCDQ